MGCHEGLHGVYGIRSYVKDRSTACDDIVNLLMGYLRQLRKHDRPQAGRLGMSKPRRKLMGRPVIDDRGNSTWQWGGASGGEVETGKVHALAEGLSLEQPNEPATVDPYNQQISGGADKPKRRSLDDMRRLNDQMKREHADLVKRLRNRISEPLARVSGLASRMRLRLRFDDRELLVDESRSGVSIGRAEDNDVVVKADRVSRLHARIEISDNKLVLIDVSANGTYVQTAGRKVSFIRRDRLQFAGHGMIGLGRRPMPGARHTIYFTSEGVL